MNLNMDYTKSSVNGTWPYMATKLELKAVQ
jgi:hypothetical protein